MKFYSGYYEHFLLNFNEIKKQLYSSELKSWKKIFYPILNPYFQNHKLYINNSNFREHVFDRYKELSSFLKHH